MNLIIEGNPWTFWDPLFRFHWFYNLKLFLNYPFSTFVTSPKVSDFEIVSWDCTMHIMVIDKILQSKGTRILISHDGSGA